MDGSSIVVIICAIVFSVLVVLASLYFLVYFQHPDDKWVAWFPKIVFIVSMSLAAYNIFLLPLDVALQKGEEYTDFADIMGKICLGFYVSSCLLVLVAVPFTVFWYEGMDGKEDEDGELQNTNSSQFKGALKWTVPLDIIAGLIIGVMWWQIGYADVPVVLLTSPFDSGSLTRTELKNISNFSTIAVSALPGYSNITYQSASFNDSNGIPTVNITQTVSQYYLTKPNITDLCAGVTCTKFKAIVTVRVSWIVYAVAIVSLIGWVLFSIFGGVGLISLPVDLVYGFINRPKRISKETYVERKKMLGEQAQILMDAGQQIQDDLKSMPKSGGITRASRNLKNKEKEFRTDVIILDFHYKRLEDAFKKQGGNFLLQLFLFICGIISFVEINTRFALTLMWILHIILYMIPNIQWFGLENPFSNFLNDFFNDISPVPFIGTVFYALFTFYLLACTVKGVTKMGMRIVFVTVHPLEVGETMMNSLIFNVGIILVSSLAVAQFNTSAFSLYAQYSAIQQTIFGVNTKYLRGISSVFDAFIFLFLTSLLLTFFSTIYRPPRKQRENRLNFQW